MSVEGIAVTPILELGAAIGLGISLFIAPYERVRQRLSEKLGRLSRIAENLNPRVEIRSAELERDFRKASKKGDTLSTISLSVSLSLSFINILGILFFIYNSEMVVPSLFPLFALFGNIIAYVCLIVITRIIAGNIFKKINEQIETVFRH